jgi:hypothetical protein
MVISACMRSATQLIHTRRSSSCANRQAARIGFNDVRLEEPGPIYQISKGPITERWQRKGRSGKVSLPRTRGRRLLRAPGKFLFGERPARDPAVRRAGATAAGSHTLHAVADH